ncbi:MAG: Na(+)-translocating NADH-quinone reductase subunit A [Pseudomonadota bacterium]
MIKIRKGLDLPIAGAPERAIGEGRSVRSVAVLGEDYPGMKPTMAVQEGDRVAAGTPLFTDKKTEGVVYTAPVAGRVGQINRGEKRALRSVVIERDGDEFVSFPSVSPGGIATLDSEQVVSTLRDSGLWTALRTRPYAKVPSPTTRPRSLFVNAMDTNPLALDPILVIESQSEAFAAGLDVLATLTDGPVYLCHEAGKSLPCGSNDRIQAHAFAGVHPAGLSGTHIHYLDPVGPAKMVWTINAQDVIAVGQLFLTGRLHSERVVALGGPGVSSPRGVRTVLGACIDELMAGELEAGKQRVISGSVLAGRTAEGAVAYLGRYHLQVSVLPEDNERRLFGYLTPGTAKHSVLPIYLAKWFGKRDLPLTTTTNGSPRGMVPVGSYEKVMPLDILPTQLLRSLLVKDVETAINLGCLELDEEDLALCTYACPGKYEFGPVLRDMLTLIEKEG